MSLFEATLLVLYFGTLALLSLYGLHRCFILVLYFRNRANAPKLREISDPLPRVTVQLPVYNERYVVERVIDAVAHLDYPRDRFEIQVLDDSTDDTSAIAERAVALWRSRGVDIVHLRRTDRTGYKAGALKEGLKTATGEFIAIFDADFVPGGDFLRQVLRGFANDRVGVVQARWGHLNRSYSLLTRAQAVLLDGHFMIEHTARNRSGRFFNFNGTAGIWRRECLEDAGGWEHDTLTEDLDLSYRAQMKAWRFVYMPDVVVPAELPAEINAFKSQQHRWAKGSIQTGLKLGTRILRAKVPMRVKLEAAAHLSSNLCYPLLLLLSVLVLPALWLRMRTIDPEAAAVFDVALFIAASISITCFYLVSQIEAEQTHWLRRTLELPVVFALGIGLAVNNTKAVLEALVGHQSPFVRTPKHALLGTQGTWLGKRYFNSKGASAAIETAIGLYLVGAVVFAAREGFYVSAAFHGLFAFGFLYVGTLSNARKEILARLARRRARSVEAVAPAVN